MNRLKTGHSPRRAKSLTFLSAALLVLFATGCGRQYMVLDPAGPVGREELHLIVMSAILVGIVIIPVLILLFYIVWRYRDKPGNTAPYTPKWSESKGLEVVWWGIPIVIVGVLGAFTAKTTFALTKPPAESADVTPITIQVTSLDWKWLFQYPGQGIATVNYAEIPTGVPIQFELTSDAPMNSFWVPQLGGQEYTMPGMAMRLWLEADKAGTYYGHGANFTGAGFAHMDFNVIATSDSNFEAWVKQVKASSPALTKAGYAQLKEPSVIGTKSYSSFPPGLFNGTIWADGGQYMPNMMNQTGSPLKAGIHTNSTGVGSGDSMSGMSNMTNMSAMSATGTSSSQK
ncbi:cytochrome c oxidase subunit II [Alicyclobacillus hesperidum URH17-3-68]|uniref:ubiquinol oxidase subunit II n=1 Tax=Alicyclobacillus hesperidum TaxID=89784 RepID=UPI000281C205|nr:cytochrome c oxidase subunit II [Alicyclobacillus hesperidum URH17-3-68]